MVLKRLQRPSRMIPRRDNDRGLDALCAEHLDGELRVLFGRPRTAFQLDRAIGHAGLEQRTPVDFAIAQAADDNARRVMLLEKFRRTFWPLAQAAAQKHDHLRLRRAAVHA